MIAAIVDAPPPRVRWPMPSRGFRPGLSLGRLRRGAGGKEVASLLLRCVYSIIQRL